MNAVSKNKKISLMIILKKSLLVLFKKKKELLLISNSSKLTRKKKLNKPFGQQHVILAFIFWRGRASRIPQQPALQAKIKG